MGVLRVVRGLFTGSTQVSESLSAFVKALAQQFERHNDQLQHLEDRVEQLSVELKRFRGRVYAWKGHELPPETTDKPAELPLSDPRVSKAELRARLLKPGKPFKHN